MVCSVCCIAGGLSCVWWKMLSQGSDRYFLCVITSGNSLSGLIRWLCAVLLLLFAAAAAVGPVLHYSEIMRVVYACSVFVLVLLTCSLFGCSCSGWCTVSLHFVGQAVFILKFVLDLFVFPFVYCFTCLVCQCSSNSWSIFLGWRHLF